jgi:hypothetical protein
MSKAFLPAAVTCALLALISAAVWPRMREPVYDGKKLSQWLDPFHPLPAEYVVPAVRQIGTNGLPFLVEWIAVKQTVPAWKAKLRSVSSRNSKFWSKRLNEFLWQTSPEASRMRASRGFEILGERGSPAIPELVRIAQNGNLESVVALSHLGKDTLPALMTFATNKTFVLRFEAIRVMGNMGYLWPSGQALVSFLTECLNDPELAEVL